MTQQEIDVRLAQLQNDKRKLEWKLSSLEGQHNIQIEHRENESFTGDSWAESQRVMNGSPEEISRTRNKLNNVISEIRRLNEARNFAKSDREVQKENELRQKEQAERAKADKEQEERLRRIDASQKKKNFERIKKINKQHLKSKKLIDRLVASKPKWSKLKNYSNEELEFLIRLSKGETAYQRCFSSSTLSDEDLKKSAEREFRSAFNNKHRLEQMMELDEAAQKQGYGRSR